MCLDVISIEKTGEHFRLVYDIKGRFTIHRISTEEAAVSVELFLIIDKLKRGGNLINCNRVVNFSLRIKNLGASCSQHYAVNQTL